MRIKQMVMTVLKKGSRGEEVKTLQKALSLAADGIFGSLTEEAVKEFQASNNLTADGIVGPKTWEKLGVQSKNRRNIKEIIVHCTATPEGKAFTNADIKRWHLERGFSDIGYHYVVYLDGSVHPGRPESVAGAHCTNHNSISIGVCYVGGVASDGRTAKDTRTPAQKEGLLKILRELKGRYPNARIYPHYKFANKACPSFDAETEYRNL